MTYAVSGVVSNINSLSTQPNVITSPVEFSTGEFCAKNVWKVFFNMAQLISKKIKDILDSL